jgi:hypothetical protein
VADSVKRFAKLAAGVDWPKVLQMGGTFLRELRSDGAAIQADAERAQGAGRKTIDTFTQIGRTAAGCSGAPDCACAFCNEGKGEHG